MAKTIKEMAENMYYPTLAEKAAYWDGVNAVLEEIEKAMDLGEPPYLISAEQAYYIVENRIKQLRALLL